MINNLPSIDSHTLKIQAAREVYSIKNVPKIQYKALNPIYAKQDFSFKALAGQVQAMAAQYNMNPVGQKFNFLA